MLTGVSNLCWSLQATTALDAKDEEIQKLREAKDNEIEALRKNKDDTIEKLLKVQQSKDDGTQKSAHSCLLCVCNHGPSYADTDWRMHYHRNTGVCRHVRARHCTLEGDSFVSAEISWLREGKGLTMDEASVSRTLQWLHLTTAIQSPSGRNLSSMSVPVTNCSPPCMHLFKEEIFFFDDLYFQWRKDLPKDISVGLLLLL